MSTAKLLIAGGTGTNGRELLNQLSAQGIGTRILVRNPDNAANIASDSIELVQGDLAEPSSLQAAFEGIEKAYIVTAIHKDTGQWFQNFFDAAKAAGVQHLVKFSGYGSDVNSASEVIRQHGHSDQALLASGLSYTIMRPNSFFQNILWQADSIRDTGQFYLPLGDSKQSQVDVRDLAEATLRILTEGGHENKAYDFTGTKSLSNHDIAATLSDELGKPVTYVPVSVDDAKASMLENGMPAWNANVLAEIQGVFSTGLYAPITDDLEMVLGRKPRIFADFAHDHAVAFGA